MTNKTFIDLFCGAGGFSYGLVKSGFHHLFGVDNCSDSKNIKRTYEHNIGKLLECDIREFDGTKYKGKIDTKLSMKLKPILTGLNDLKKILIRIKLLL